MKILVENIEKQNIFKVPNKYFERLLLSIETQIEVENEEKTFNFKAKQPNFTIPENYFQNLSDKILTRISETEKPKINLENLEKVNIFKVPDVYFDDLASILKFESHEKENVFKVENNYFETLSDKILAKTINQKQGKIIKVNWWQNNSVKWSAAASIVFLIGFLWLFLPKFSESKTELALQKVSNEEISKYLENQDLSLIESEATAKINIQNADNQLLEHLELNENDILKHLENEEIEDI